MKDGFNGCRYTGEVDKTGKLCGHGFYTKQDCPNVRYEGTFLNDEWHGISRSPYKKSLELILSIHRGTNSWQRWCKI